MAILGAPICTLATTYNILTLLDLGVTSLNSSASNFLQIEWEYVSASLYFKNGDKDENKGLTHTQFRGCLIDGTQSEV